MRKNKVPSSSNPIISAAEADIEGFKVALSQQPGRLDLSLSPIQNNESLKMPLMDVQAGIFYCERILAAVEILPESVRLSCIVNSYSEASSSEDVANLFYSIAGFNPDIPEVTDLVFQANRRTDLEGVLINRVTTINTLETQSIRMQGSTLAETSVEHGLGITYDFNTVPDGTVFDTERQKKLFADMLGHVTKAVNSSDLSFLKD